MFAGVFLEAEYMAETKEKKDLNVQKEQDDSLKKENRRKKKSRIFKPVITVIIVAFCFYAVYDIIVQQAEIEQLQKETAEISEKIQEQQRLNDEYMMMLESDEAEYMEKVAVEEFGYAYPNERRFYIVSGSED